jgi:hypothetical protein
VFAGFWIQTWEDSVLVSNAFAGKRRVILGCNSGSKSWLYVRNKRVFLLRISALNREGAESLRERGRERV